MTLTLASNAAGSFTVVATNGTGSTSSIPSISNTLTVVTTDPFADSDGDGLSNIYEAAIATNYAAASTTGDGLPDGWVLFYTSVPPLNAALAGQIAPNGLTYLLSFQQGLNPLLNTVVPSVSNVYPANTTTNYPTNGVIVVRFTEPLQGGVSLTTAQSAVITALPMGSNFSSANASAAAQVLQTYLQRTCCGTTAIPGSVQILQNGKPVAGNVYLSNDRLSLTFAPTRYLSSSTAYTVSVQGVQDAGGHVMAQPFTSMFTTGLSPNLTTPGAGFTNPAQGATGVDINSTIRIEFSSPVNPATLMSTTFSVVDLFTGSAVSGTIQVDPFLLTASFVPAQPWGVGRPIRATLTSGITDFAGHSFFPSGTTLSFTTGFASDTQGLNLVGTSPSDGSTNVPLNALVILEFGEPIDGISALNGLQVQQAGVPIPGAIALSDGNKRLTFTPSALLAANSTYLIVTTPRLTDFAGNALSNPDTSTFTTGSTTDATQPTVVTVSPANGATGAPTNALVQAQFSKPIDPLTVTSSTFSVSESDTIPQIAAAGTIAVSSDGLTATFTPMPSAPLASGTSYTIQLAAPIADLEGHTLASFPSTTFTTGAGTVTTAPTVLTVSPPNGTTGVPVNPRIDVVASAPISAASPWSTAVILSTGGVTAPGTTTLSSDRKTLTFVPTNLLAVSTTYTIGVSGFTDQAGNVVTPRTTSFTTGTSGVANTTQPSVVPPTNPTNGATGVPVTSNIVLTFNEAIDPTTVKNTTVPITLNSTFGPVLAGSYAVSGTTVTFTPLTPLPGSTLVFVGVPVNGVQDLSGNKNTTVNFSSSFTTASVADTTAPQVVSVAPNNGATGIGLNAAAVLTFSKSLNPNTINSNTFGLLANGTKLNVSIAHSADNRVVSLTPLGTLLPGSSTVTVVATSGVQDLSGNALANFESQFTTAAAFDIAHPSVFVLGQRPGLGATGVPINTSVVLYVNEAMNTATISGALHVSQNGVLVSGTTAVTDGGQTIQFTPSSPFSYSSVIQVFLDNTALDVDGSSLTSYQGSFNTAANPSTTAPSIVSTNPLSGTGAIPTNVAFDIGFNQMLNAATVNTTNVILRQGVSGGTVVPSTVSLLTGGTVIQITPNATLAANTSYNYQLTSGVQNANGLAFTGQSFSFTTGAGPDTVAPTIAFLSPHNGLANVGDNASVSLVFSKPINQLSVSGSTIQLTDGVTTAVPDSINFSNTNQNVQLVPHAPLPDATLMTLTISGVTDVAGNAVATQTTHFTTGTGPDVVTPTVVAESPFSGESNVPLNTIIQVQVNDPIDPGTVTSSSFVVFDSTTSQTVAGSYSVSADGLTITFLPNAPLAANHTISVDTGNHGMKNLVGNLLATGGLSAFVFSTGTAANTTAPQVVGISPPNGMTGVPINAQVAIQFNEPVDALTVNQVTLTGGGTVNVTRTLTNGNQILLLIPVLPLSPSTTYTVTVTGIQDVSGNSLGAPVTQTFTTGPGADLTPPSAVSVPANNATGVLRNSAIQLQFSKQIDPFMVTNSTFTVRPAGGQPIAGTIVVSANGLTATFTPSTTLAASTQYQISATNGITDLEGQPLTSFSSFFTTGTQ